MNKRFTLVELLVGEFWNKSRQPPRDSFQKGKEPSFSCGSGRRPNRVKIHRKVEPLYFGENPERIFSKTPLVVIAIISILAGLLLPALGRARRKAREIFCLNVAKRLSLGWFMYAGDADDVMLPFMRSMRLSLPGGLLK